MVAAGAVLEEQQRRAFGDDHAAVVELEARRAVQMVGKHGALVGVTGAFGVFEDQNLVVQLFLRLPVRIAGPDGDPQPPLGVELHLHGLRQIGKLLLVGEQVDLEALGEGHRLDFFLAGEEDVLAVGAFAGLVGFDRRGTAAYRCRRPCKSPPLATAQIRLSRLAVITSSTSISARPLRGWSADRRTPSRPGRRRSSSRRACDNALNQQKSLSIIAWRSFSRAAGSRCGAGCSGEQRHDQ